MWTAKAAAAAAAATGTRDSSARMWGCERTRKRGTGNKNLRAEINPHCHHWHGWERVTWPVVETMLTKLSEEGEMAFLGLRTASPSVPATTPYEPLLPCPLTTPNVPPQLPPNGRPPTFIWWGSGRDPSFQRCRFGIPTHLCKRTEKEKKTYWCPLFLWADWVCVCDRRSYNAALPSESDLD